MYKFRFSTLMLLSLCFTPIASAANDDLDLTFSPSYHNAASVKSLNDQSLDYPKELFLDHLKEANPEQENEFSLNNFIEAFKISVLEKNEQAEYVNILYQFLQKRTREKATLENLKTKEIPEAFLIYYLLQQRIINSSPDPCTASQLLTKAMNQISLDGQVKAISLYAVFTNKKTMQEQKQSVLKLALSLYNKADKLGEIWRTSHQNSSSAIPNNIYELARAWEEKNSNSAISHGLNKLEKEKLRLTALGYKLAALKAGAMIQEIFHSKSGYS